MENDFDYPQKICELLIDHFPGEVNPKKIYKYLLDFGMYKPNAQSRKTFEEMKSRKLWERIEKITIKYKKKWNGPDLPIFIFPMDETNGRLMREGKGKSGVSFTDKLFLFLTPIDDIKELEALYVHEYHHACRMNGLTKNPNEYTLLDSMILEGLAEHAVASNCGEEYTGEWSRRYSTKELEKHWKKDLSEKLFITRNDYHHDQILFGLGNRPRLLGYAMGYEIVKQYKQHENFTEKASFKIPSEKFTEMLNF